jgi:hypothetical protein
MFFGYIFSDKGGFFFFKDLNLKKGFYEEELNFRKYFSAFTDMIQ